ncbi:hypothetical protein GCM10027612_10230 [Microbispora bryophytorum subsp. camponoti]
MPGDQRGVARGVRPLAGVRYGAAFGVQGDEPEVVVEPGIADRRRRPVGQYQAAVAAPEVRRAYVAVDQAVSSVGASAAAA